MRKQKIIKMKIMTEIYDYMTAKSYQSNKKKPRLPRRQLTKEEVARNNFRMAKAKLRRLIANNFEPNDYYITLTIKERVDIETAKKYITNFNRRLRDAFKRAKAKAELKYIYILEGKKKYHFHMLINRGIELTSQLMKKLWPHGFTDIKLYHGEAEDAIRLAEYFTKERTENKHQKRWVKSNSVKHPKEIVKVVKATEWRKEVKVPNGYYLDKDSYYEGINNAGYPYRFYRLVRLHTGRCKYT
ncbi:rolling circle replication-associated protein [Veillonella montpellierensis]|uniref:rolling circle replication-associated protein n=1 Tax=Veillonella montpellierensis TaxID=187328 RepID=UPI0023F803F0|nr:hypothetical protein [Veillonella montpellierensis]